MNKNDLIIRAKEEYSLNYFDGEWQYKILNKWKDTDDISNVEELLNYIWVMDLDQDFNQKMIREAIEYFIGEDKNE